MDFIKILNIILKSNHNNNIRFIKIIISIVVLQYILLIHKSLSTDYGETSFYTELDIRMWIIFSLAFSTIITLISFPRKAIHVIELKDIKGISPFVKLLEYYALLLPPFIFCVGILSIGISRILYDLFNIYIIFLIIGLISCFLFSPLAFILLLFLKLYYDSKIYYTFQRAKNIYNDYIIKNPKSIHFNEFNKYFKKYIKNIDRELKNGIKIDDLNKGNNKSIKNAIFHYMPVYLKFGDQSNINFLHSQINEMEKSINKQDDIISLKLTENIFNIYMDINYFLDSNGFSITEQRNIKNIVFWLIIIIGTIISLYLVMSEKIHIISDIISYSFEFVSAISTSTLLVVSTSIIVALIGAVGLIIAAFIQKPRQ
jgi:hypothetical protein